MRDNTFFVLATNKGFVVNFMPDGRTASKTKQQEYGNTSGQGKIETMILHVVDIIGRFKNKQKNRLSEHT